jgi:cytoskeletal protein RodZ
MSAGDALRAAREAAGISLDELAAKTRIRAGLIAAIEVGNYQAAGGQAYLRGHIRVLAQALSMPDADLDELLCELSPAITTSLTDNLADSNVTTLRKNSGINPSFSFLSYVAVAILGLVILVPSATSIFKSHNVSKHPVAKLAAKSNAKVIATGAKILQSPTTTVAANPVANTLVITASNGASWLSVTGANGASLYAGMIKQGESQSFDVSTLINVTIGNSGAVDIVNSGSDLGAPGTSGAVSHLQFGPGVNSLSAALSTNLSSGSIQG